MIIREITANDAAAFFNMMCRLDEETDHMMYEPGERQAGPRSPDRIREIIEAAVSEKDLLLAAVNDEGEMVGFLHAERGKLNRIRHTAYIVTGIRQAFRRQGIGTALFRRLDSWARENGVIRLELTVECSNTGAVSLYEKQGFRKEGLRAKSMSVSGVLTDEYYMAKIFD